MSSVKSGCHRQLKAKPRCVDVRSIEFHAEPFPMQTLSDCSGGVASCKGVNNDGPRFSSGT